MSTPGRELPDSLPGVQAVALGFNAVIFLAAGFCVLVAAVFGVFTDLTNLLFTAVMLLAMGGLQVFLKRGWLRSTSIAMLSLVFAGVYFSMYRFGSVSIAQASLACVPIIYCVVVLGANAGGLLVVISVLASGWITWAQLHGYFASAPPILPIAQWVVLTAGFIIAYRMAVLMKRHLLDANAAALEALAELKSQRFVVDQHAIVIKSDLAGFLTYGNQKFSEVSGYSPEEFLGKHGSFLRSGVHTAEFFADLFDTINSGRAWHAEICHRAKDGSLFWLDATVSAILNEDGTPREYISVNTDITQMRQARQAAHAANQAKSEFLANMSHEIRTPMNGVIGMLEVLRTTPLNAQQQRMLGTVHGSSLALLQILNDILDFSKIEAGKMDLETVTVPLRETIETVTGLLAGIADSQDIDFSVQIAADLPDLVQTDPTRLRQILFNLLGNALKFTQRRDGQRSFARLEAGRARLSGGGPALEFRISDNGIGMEPQQVEQLFEAFAQADVSTARKFGGTGLGLSITRRLVELLQGELQVHSRPAEGSVFTVRLPLAADPAQPADGTVAALPQGGPVRSAPAPLLLLVEDNLTNRDVTLEQLHVLGYAAEWAPDGAAGLALWRTGRHALVLTDCQMPHMDGFQMTAAIRNAETPWQHTPIVALTANAMGGDAQRCLDAGMDDYLAKPLRLQALQSMLSRWLQSVDAPHSADAAAPPGADAAQAHVVWNPHALVEALGTPDWAAQQDMLRRFAVHSAAQLREMQRLMEGAGDLAAVRALAHNAKSAAWTVGAMQLGHACSLLERCCDEGDAAGARAQLAEAVRAFGLVQAQLPATRDQSAAISGD